MKHFQLNWQSSTFLVCIFSVLLLNATYGSLADEPSLFSPLSCGVSDITRSFWNKTVCKHEDTIKRLHNHHLSGNDNLASASVPSIKNLHAFRLKLWILTFWQNICLKSLNICWALTFLNLRIHLKLSLTFIFHFLWFLYFIFFFVTILWFKLPPNYFQKSWTWRTEKDNVSPIPAFSVYSSSTHRVALLYHPLLSTMTWLHSKTPPEKRKEELHKLFFIITFHIISVALDGQNNQKESFFFLFRVAYLWAFFPSHLHFPFCNFAKLFLTQFDLMLHF